MMPLAVDSSRTSHMMMIMCRWLIFQRFCLSAQPECVRKNTNVYIFIFQFFFLFLSLLILFFWQWKTTQRKNKNIHSSHSWRHLTAGQRFAFIWNTSHGEMDTAHQHLTLPRVASLAATPTTNCDPLRKCHPPYSIFARAHSFAHFICARHTTETMEQTCLPSHTHTLTAARPICFHIHHLISIS